MTWCDKLGSTPTVGLKLEWRYTSGSKLLDALTPLLEDLHEGDEPAFGIESVDEFHAVFTTNQGFQYSVDANRIAVGFASRVKLRHPSAMHPTIEILSEPKPYSELLPITSEKLIEAAMLLPGAERRKFFRIGIISKTLALEDEFPPGIRKLVRHFGRPWASAPEAYNLSLTTPLKDTPKWTERCIHNLTKSEAAKNVPVVAFDWQRTFKVAHVLNRETLKSEIAEAARAAIDYLEELAEGNRFDEDCTS